MKSTRPVRADKLCVKLQPERIPYADSSGIPVNGKRHSPQLRALEALDLALHIPSQGFNVYLSGESDLGRSYLLRDVLMPRARKKPTPPDLIYVCNFDDPDSPLLISLPAGMGKKLKSALHKLFASIQATVTQRLESSAHTRRRTSLMGNFQNQRENLLHKMNEKAGAQGFNLGMDEGGSMTLYPLVEGRRLNEQEYESLEEGLRKELRIKGDSLIEPMSSYLRKLAKMEQDFQDEERRLERELVDEVLKSQFDPLANKFISAAQSPALENFLTKLRADALDKLELLMPQEIPPLAGQRQSAGPYPHADGPAPEDLQAKFDINLFVDNSATSGAPVIFEDHPTLSNLMGCIERESELGALVTDFTLIKSGSIHKANGGYLVLHMEDLLQQPHAWEALLRSLRSGFSRIEDSGEEASKTKGLRPEAVPVSLKVILVGKEELYELMLCADERFSKLFKIKAHLTEHMQRNSANMRIFLSHLRRIVEDDGLLPFDREALAELIDLSSKLIEDQQKLSLKYPRIREVMVEASAYASMRGRERIDGEILRHAMKARKFRSNLVEESFMEEYDRGIIKVPTSGEAVGTANGLAVILYGDFEFGLPHQISCTVGAGYGGVIDLERDAKLGGPIHTKAMMILKSYLVGAFAHNKPLVFTGSLGFEQNYGGIEGDSASGAELAALLSALAGAPIRLNLAFTGAVGQSGQIMAVGGVTPKIEGFFEVCKRHGLTGDQGVILPKDNLPHVLLGDEALEAIRDGKFHVYAVEHITEAMEILTGMKAGKLRRDNTYTKGSLYRLADEKLSELTRISVTKEKAAARRKK